MIADPSHDDWPFVLPPGWFIELETAVVTTHIGLGVYGPPSPALDNLDWTVLPIGKLGYRFDSGDAVVFDYRFLSEVANAGSDVGEPFTEDHVTFLSQEFTLDYQSRVYQPASGVGLQWQAGVRIAAFNFTTLDHWQGLEADQDRQTVVAAGPYVGFKPAVQIGESGLTAFVLIDGSELVGLRTQQWQSTTPTGTGTGTTTSTWTSYALSPALEFGWEAGLSYTPPSLRQLRISGGYQGEWLFWVGRSFIEQGPFLRVAVGF